MNRRIENLKLSVPILLIPLSLNQICAKSNSKRFFLVVEISLEKVKKLLSFIMNAELGTARRFRAFASSPFRGILLTRSERMRQCQ